MSVIALKKSLAIQGAKNTASFSVCHFQCQQSSIHQQCSDRVQDLKKENKDNNYNSKYIERILTYCIHSTSIVEIVIDVSDNSSFQIP